MSVPAAHLPESLAVLVLAWDEAAPAVRTLVEGTPTRPAALASLLVLVPQAGAPGLSAEDYLPLAPPAVEASTTPTEVAAPHSLAEAAVPLAETPPPAPAANTIVRAEALEEDGEPATDELLLPGQLLATPPEPAAALGWAAVRVLRLASYSLPQLAQRAGQPLPAPTWLGPAAVPAAPYLGAELLPATDAPAAPAPAPTPATAAPLRSVAMGSALPRPAEVGPPTLASTVASPPPGADALPAEALAPLPQTAALETDFLPQEADELAQFELAGATAAAQDDGAAAGPEQAGWPEALAALRQPAAAPVLRPAPAAARSGQPESPASALPTLASPAARRLPAAHYPAPDLNFQIIQYARFAVPVVLAEPPFAVIYAPAWPTWLAAQELRQRTGRPLVLHLSALAAPEGESADTAAGWMAELQRQALRRADVVLVETPALAQRLCRELGLATDCVRVVPAADAAAIAQALHEAPAV